jgi:hypothetical protein
MKKIFASWGRVMIVAVLIKFMDLGGDVFALNTENLKHLAQAGIAALIPVLIRFFNPNDDAFGVVKAKEEA